MHKVRFFFSVRLTYQLRPTWTSLGAPFEFNEGPRNIQGTWWCHQMETFSTSLALCLWNSLAPGEFSTQRPVTWSFDVFFDLHPNKRWRKNKANLRDLKAATGLVISLKLDSNHRFLAGVTLKFDGWPRKIIRHVFYTTWSFVYHFISISEFKLELQSGNAKFGSNSTIFRAVWPWNLKDDLEKQ